MIRREERRGLNMRKEREERGVISIGLKSVTVNKMMKKKMTRKLRG
jgi:hypothetical protein